MSKVRLGAAVAAYGIHAAQDYAGLLRSSLGSPDPAAILRTAAMVVSTGAAALLLRAMIGAVHSKAAWQKAIDLAALALIGVAVIVNWKIVFFRAAVSSASARQLRDRGPMSTSSAGSSSCRSQRAADLGRSP